MATTAAADSAPMAKSASAPSGSAAAPEYSTTNNQVEGVDESDIVKTDGNYIYTLSTRNGYSNYHLVITKTSPASSMAVVTRLRLKVLTSLTYSLRYMCRCVNIV